VFGCLKGLVVIVLATDLEVRDSISGYQIF
jgi:hypothetical protein